MTGIRPSETIAVRPGTARLRPRARLPELDPVRVECARKLPYLDPDGGHHAALDESRDLTKGQRAMGLAFLVS
jgi:hypothetical protein